MIGFGVGGVLMGRLSDRFGIIVPVLIGAVALGAGYVAGGDGQQPVAVRARLRLLIGVRQPPRPSCR